MIHLENEWLEVAIAKSGAELREVYHKKNGLSYMWNGDSTYWGRVSPVLFPIVGRLKKDQYTLNGKLYRLSQHGFLRDVEFDVQQHSKTTAALQFESAGAFLDVYPYEFKAVIRYELHENSVKVSWDITNENDETMFFSIGGHPAFKVPLASGETKKDYVLNLTAQDSKEVTEFELEDSLVKEKNTSATLDPLPVDASLFQNDALIYSNIQEASLLSRTTGHGVKMTLQGFPFFGVWSRYSEVSKTMAPFVCLEPWHGLADTIDATGNFKEKKGINQLPANKTFHASYSITFQ